MSLTGGFAIYFILWWLAFIAVLPFGVRTIEECGEVESGHAPSAPSRPMLVQKSLAATVIAAIVWSGVYALFEYSGLKLEDIPFLNPVRR